MKCKSNFKGKENICGEVFAGEGEHWKFVIHVKRFTGWNTRASPSLSLALTTN
jgi:hypothetical protein